MAIETKPGVAAKAAPSAAAVMDEDEKPKLAGLLVYSTLPSQRVCVRPDEVVYREGKNGRQIRMTESHAVNLDFKHHEARLAPEFEKELRTKNWYGVEFILHKDLKEMLTGKDPKKRKAGYAFIKELVRRSVTAGRYTRNGKPLLDEDTFRDRVTDSQE